MHISSQNSTSIKMSFNHYLHLSADLVASIVVVIKMGEKFVTNYLRFLSSFETVDKCVWACVQYLKLIHSIMW